MSARLTLRLGILLALVPVGSSLAQMPPGLLSPPAPRTAAPAVAAPAPPPAPAFTADARGAIAGPGVRVTKGAGVLPNEHGQVWREYDISPYTQTIQGVEKPEQAVIDWILRETGTEVWFAEPLGILSATPTCIRVYHTPQMQETVRGMIDRFVSTANQPQALGVRLMTVGSPNWRSAAVSLLKPVDVKSAGVEAWLLSKENAALLFEQLKNRGDFREHSAPKIEIANGQQQKLARTQPRQYTRSVQMKQVYPFYDLIPGKIDEGYSLELSPLLSLDGQTIETAVTCKVDQVEKLLPLAIDLPIGGQSQRVQIQVPQVVSWRLAERFRWPANEVLLLSCGVVATPGGNVGGPLAFMNPLANSSRADALLMIEHKGPVAKPQ
jgi:hypothetical protein